MAVNPWCRGLQPWYSKGIPCLDFAGAIIFRFSAFLAFCLQLSAVGALLPMRRVVTVGRFAALRTFPAIGLIAATSAYLAGNFVFSLLVHEIIVKLNFILYSVFSILR